MQMHPRVLLSWIAAAAAAQNSDVSSCTLLLLLLLLLHTPCRMKCTHLVA
jgi:hypothetical protein